MDKKFKLHPVIASLWLLAAALVLISCGNGRSSAQLFEPAIDQSALESAYSTNQVPAESKMDYRYAQQNRPAANAAAFSAATNDSIPAESKMDYWYAVQSGGLEQVPSDIGNENTLDFWYARQNGYHHQQ